MELFSWQTLPWYWKVGFCLRLFFSVAPYCPLRDLPLWRYNRSAHLIHPPQPPHWNLSLQPRHCWSPFYTRTGCSFFENFFHSLGMIAQSGAPLNFHIRNLWDRSLCQLCVLENFFRFSYTSHLIMTEPLYDFKIGVLSFSETLHSCLKFWSSRSSCLWFFKTKNKTLPSGSIQHPLPRRITYNTLFDANRPPRAR